MKPRWFGASNAENKASTTADQRRAEAAQRIVAEAMERDRLALELAAKSIFRAGSVR